MLIFETPVFAITTNDWLLILGHSVATVFLVTTYNLSTVICGLIISSLICSLEIPTGIFLQWTLFADIQKQQMNGIDIVGGVLVLIAVIMVPIHQFYEERKTHRNENTEQIQILQEK